VDISESKDSFIIKAGLPGMDEKDVNVSISGEILTIKGEKKGGGRKRRALNTQIGTKYNERF